MATYLVVSNNGERKTFSCTSTINKPRMRVSDSYIPLTTTPTSGLNLYINGYRLMEYKLTSSSCKTQSISTRNSQYDYLYGYNGYLSNKDYKKTTSSAVGNLSSTTQTAYTKQSYYQTTSSAVGNLSSTSQISYTRASTSAYSGYTSNVVYANGATSKYPNFSWTKTYTQSIYQYTSSSNVHLNNTNQIPVVSSGLLTITQNSTTTTDNAQNVYDYITKQESGYTTSLSVGKLYNTTALRKTSYSGVSRTISDYIHISYTQSKTGNIIKYTMSISDAGSKSFKISHLTASGASGRVTGFSSKSTSRTVYYGSLSSASSWYSKNCLWITFGNAGQDIGMREQFTSLKTSNKKYATTLTVRGNAVNTTISYTLNYTNHGVPVIITTPVYYTTAYSGRTSSSYVNYYAGYSYIGSKEYYNGSSSYAKSTTSSIQGDMYNTAALTRASISAYSTIGSLSKVSTSAYSTIGYSSSTSYYSTSSNNVGNLSSTTPIYSTSNRESSYYYETTSQVKYSTWI